MFFDFGWAISLENYVEYESRRESRRPKIDEGRGHWYESYIYVTEGATAGIITRTTEISVVISTLTVVSLSP